MYKLRLIFSNSTQNMNVGSRESGPLDMFFTSKREAQHWLDFYKRRSPFMDGEIVHSYIMKFSF